MMSRIKQIETRNRETHQEMRMRWRENEIRLRREREGETNIYLMKRSDLHTDQHEEPLTVWRFVSHQTHSASVAMESWRPISISVSVPFRIMCGSPLWYICLCINDETRRSDQHTRNHHDSWPTAEWAQAGNRQIETGKQRLTTRLLLNFIIYKNIFYYETE